MSYVCDKAGHPTAATVAGGVAVAAGGAKVGASCYRRYCRDPVPPPQGPQGVPGQNGYVLEVRIRKSRGQLRRSFKTQSAVLLL